MKKYPFNIDEDLMGPLKDSGLLTTDADIMNTYNFEIDSKAGTKRVKKIENEIAKKEKSLLNTVPGHIMEMEMEDFHPIVIFFGLL